ncbi:hypothetical protein JCM19240_5516 [Vibrio maritimus]|uniref:Oxidoreductase molybdopterin-binding domain-containing protein n=1 Tax=Vibrio maritimus TaxID=990268 RepID=A0A090SWE8_9VIBR|nr:hypothetical protein JCM19240_5516 [Vibrio maritimus]
MRIAALIASLTALLWFFSTPLLAADLTLRSGGVVVKKYSDTDLSSMPKATIDTELPWLEGMNQFTGVKLEELFTQANTPLPELITFIALNDYKVSIRQEDIKQYQPIIANRKNGKRMSIRDKGPYWVIFPLSQYPEIDNTNYHSMMIWQLKEVRY